MLNLINPEDGNEHVVKLVKEYRKTQVSRFPVDVRFSPRKTWFYDTRHPDKHIAILGYDTNPAGEYVFTIESRLINSARLTGDRAHQKITKDPKKMLKFMRDFIRTVSIGEMANASKHQFESSVHLWKEQALSKVRDYCTLGRDDLMEEVTRMKAVGYVPQTKKFTEIMEMGLEHWEERKRRAQRKVMQVYVHVNPDETVELYCPDHMGYAGIQHGNNFYETLADAPTCIQQQVAMLRMMELKTFVPEVGIRVSESSCWVEVMGE